MASRRKQRALASGARRRARGRRLWILLALLVLVVVAGTMYSRKSNTAAALATPAAAPSSFEPTVPNSAIAPGLAPQGMAWIPGGEFSMGANDPPDMNAVGLQATEDARPIHRVYVDSFFMDRTDVTNAQFETFVRATGYVTVAERAPRAEDLPNAPRQNLVVGSIVFAPPDHGVPLNDHRQWWHYVTGANWRHPLGPKSDL